jgi:hypothetical protein
MSKKIKPITHDEWVAEMFKTTTQVPKGYLSTKEIAKMTNSNERTTRGRLNERVRKGQLEIIKVLVDGSIVNYYTPVKK